MIMKGILTLNKEYRIKGTVVLDTGEAIPYVKNGNKVIWSGVAVSGMIQNFDVEFQAADYDILCTEMPVIPGDHYITTWSGVSCFETYSTGGGYYNVGDDWLRKVEKEDPHEGQTYNAYNDTWHWF